MIRPHPTHPTLSPADHQDDEKPAVDNDDYEPAPAEPKDDEDLSFSEDDVNNNYIFGDTAAPA